MEFIVVVEKEIRKDSKETDKASETGWCWLFLTSDLEISMPFPDTYFSCIIITFLCYLSSEEVRNAGLLYPHNNLAK